VNLIVNQIYYMAHNRQGNHMIDIWYELIQVYARAC